MKYIKKVVQWIIKCQSKLYNKYPFSFFFVFFGVNVLLMMPKRASLGSLPPEIIGYLHDNFLCFNDLFVLLNVNHWHRALALRTLNQQYKYPLANLDNLDEKNKAYHLLTSALVQYEDHQNGRTGNLIRLIGSCQDYLTEKTLCKLFCERIFCHINRQIYMGMRSDHKLNSSFSSLFSNLLWTSPTKDFSEFQIELWNQFSIFFERLLRYLCNPKGTQEHDLDGTTSRTAATYIWHLAGIGLFNRVKVLVEQSQEYPNSNVVLDESFIERFTYTVWMFNVLSIFLRHDHVRRDSPFFTVLTFEEYAMRSKLAGTVEQLAFRLETVFQSADQSQFNQV